MFTIKYVIERVGLRQTELHGHEAFGKEKCATVLEVATEQEEKNVQEPMEKRGIIGCRDVAELSGILVLSTMTGAATGTVILDRPGGDGGNDSALLEEVSTMEHVEDD